MRILGALGLTLVLAACGGEAPAPVPSGTVADTPVENASGVSVGDARVQLPVVSGRPGVAYFTLTQANGAPRKLTGVKVALVGRAEMHETVGGTMKRIADVPLDPGTTLKFEPGGKHVMLFELDPKLRFEKEAELTATLDDGATASAKAAVTTVAEAMEHDH